MSRNQPVHLNRTMSGIPGLFTGNTLAWHITEEQYEEFSTDREALERYVRTLPRFELESEPYCSHCQKPCAICNCDGGVGENYV